MVDDLENCAPHTIPDSREKKILQVLIGSTSLETICTNEKGELLARAGNVMGQSELNYTKVEKILLALVHFYSKHSTILLGQEVLKTNCKALKNGLEVKTRSERVERLLLQLPCYSTFEIELLNAHFDIERVTISENSSEEIFYIDGACTANGKRTC